LEKNPKITPEQGNSAKEKEPGRDKKKFRGLLQGGGGKIRYLVLQTRKNGKCGHLEKNDSKEGGGELNRKSIRGNFSLRGRQGNAGGEKGKSQES